MYEVCICCNYQMYPSEYAPFCPDCAYSGRMDEYIAEQIKKNKPPD